MDFLFKCFYAKIFYILFFFFKQLCYFVRDPRFHPHNHGAVDVKICE